MAFIKGLRARSAARAGDALYRHVVAQARAAGFYADVGVPDTLDGRFDMIALHGFLLLHRLKGNGRDAEVVAQALYDAMFADMDHNLREIGVGDLSVGRKVKTMAQAFNGRTQAYDAALAAAPAAGGTGAVAEAPADSPADPSADPLVDALRRNVYGSLESVDRAYPTALARYTRALDSALASQPLAAILEGTVALDSVAIVAPVLADRSPDAGAVDPTGQRT